MKSFKFYLSEKKKDVVLISTQFGSHSVSKPKKQTEDETQSVEDKFYSDPELQTSIHEDLDASKFHRQHRMKDEIHPDIKNHQGWLRNYSDNNTRAIHDALYNHHANNKIETTVYNSPERHEQNLSIAHETEKVIAKHRIGSDHTVYTGIPQIHAEKFKNRKEPLKVHHPSFISTSTDFDQAVKFTGGAKNSPEENHVLRIRVPKGTQGGSMSGNTYYPKEKEVLLQRGHDLEVHHEPTIIKHPKHGDIHVWDAKIVGHNPKPLNAKPILDVLHKHQLVQK